MDLAKFNSAFSAARHRVRKEQADIAIEQARLRDLVQADDAQEDREWALGLIDSLAEPPPPPRQWSPLYHEAARIHAAAYENGRTVEEQIAGLEEARRRIWEIADRASDEEEADIRAMTRVLEHLENGLRNPSWPLDDPPPRTD